MATSTYIERNCTFRGYESGGAVVTPEYAVAYIGKGKGKDGAFILTNWHGTLMTRNVKITASWKTPRSYVSDRMYQVEATIDGVRYTGRTPGTGMSWRGKRTAQQPA